MKPGKDERRASRRVALRARVRVRAAGTNGIGTLCRVQDASACGIRVLLDGCAAKEWSRLEILSASGFAPREPIHARVVRTAEPQRGRQEIACELEPGGVRRRRRIPGFGRGG